MSQPTIFISVYAALGEEAGKSCLIVTFSLVNNMASSNSIQIRSKNVTIMRTVTHHFEIFVRTFTNIPNLPIIIPSSYIMHHPIPYRHPRSPSLKQFPVQVSSLQDIFKKKLRYAPTPDTEVVTKKMLPTKSPGVRSVIYMTRFSG